MTEAEWAACGEPQKMLEFLGAKASDRKFRLFLCACCRSMWHLLLDSESRHIVELAEQFADGLATKGDLEQANGPAWNAALYADGLPAKYAERMAVWSARIDPAERTLALVQGELMKIKQLGQEVPRVALLFRCIFGNPFHPPSPLPEGVLAWNDATVRRIAEGIYEERAFERLPILADALIDAGCEQEELIGHFRLEEPHVRGCWGIDLILGRS